jgi:hypothetical protein
MPGARHPADLYPPAYMNDRLLSVPFAARFSTRPPSGSCARRDGRSRVSRPEGRSRSSRGDPGPRPGGRDHHAPPGVLSGRRCGPLRRHLDDLPGRGLDVRIEKGLGPVLPTPSTPRRGSGRWSPSIPSETLDFVMETLRILKARLDVPVLGFIGAPVHPDDLHGGVSPESRTARAPRAFMWRDPSSGTS